LPDQQAFNVSVCAVSYAGQGSGIYFGVLPLLVGPQKAYPGCKNLLLQESLKFLTCEAGLSGVTLEK